MAGLKRARSGPRTTGTGSTAAAMTVEVTAEATTGDAMTAEVTAEATTGDAVTEAGTAAAIAMMPVVATLGGCGNTSGGNKATPTAEGQPQEGTDLDLLS
ncbi:hypothetical protein MTO96_025672 [Rhipicephalus appendiculatus]